MKRAVYLRDQGRCAFIGSTGRRCGERGVVEFHHVEPYEAGGSPTTQNIALRCRLCRARQKRHYAESRIMPRQVVSPDAVAAKSVRESA